MNTRLTGKINIDGHLQFSPEARQFLRINDYEPRAVSFEPTESTIAPDGTKTIVLTVHPPAQRAAP